MRDAVGLSDELAVPRTGGERMQRARDRLLRDLRTGGRPKFGRRAEQLDELDDAARVRNQLLIGLDDGP